MSTEASVRILREAAEELEAAAVQLEEERAGLGAELLAAYERKLRQIARFPKSGPVVQGLSSVRAFPLRRFRYVLIVGDVEGELVIVAFAHMRRRPGYWRDRIE